MPIIRLETVIAASAERCFDLCRDVGAHIASTTNTNERVVAGRISGLLSEGDEVTWEATHLGVRQRLTARVVRCERPHVLVDVMVRGAFAGFTHTHEFEAHPCGTLMRDSFDYRAPLWILGRLADVLFLERYMHRFLAGRARALKGLAEAPPDPQNG
jgi:ligand-binding SRPBCC domain-containing protein